MPRPTHNPDYVFQQFPEMLVIDGKQIVVNDEAEKAEALKTAAPTPKTVKGTAWSEKAS